MDRFPLHLHASGNWYKTHRKKYYYFGHHKEAALKRYVNEWPAIIAGGRPEPSPDGKITLADLFNGFLESKQLLVNSQEITLVHFRDYVTTFKHATKMFGREREAASISPADFARLRASLASRYGPVTLGNIIQRVRTAFKWGYEAGHLLMPMRFGPDFAKPSRRVIRLQRADRGSKMIEAEVIRRMIHEAGTPLNAMILLAINCGYGQGDCSDLPRASLKRAGWIDFRRPKTGAERRCPLWPETIGALAVAAKQRPRPADPADADQVFLTRFGRRFGAGPRSTEGARTDGIGQEFGKLVKRMNVEVQGGFYTLRHVHRTIADRAKDRVAAALIMGHVDESMAAAYREGVDDDRLIAVAGVIREWLFG